MSVQQERQRQTTQTDRDGDRDRDTETDRQTDGQRDRDKQTDGQTDRSKRTSVPDPPPPTTLYTLEHPSWDHHLHQTWGPGWKMRLAGGDD